MFYMNLFVMMECKKKLKIAVLGHFAKYCTRQRTPLPSAMVTALGKARKMGAQKTIFLALPSTMTIVLSKEFFFKKNSNFAKCRPEGTRQRFFFKKKSNFAECRLEGTRQRIFFFKKNSNFAERQPGTLGKEFLEKN